MSRHHRRGARTAPPRHAPQHARRGFAREFARIRAAGTGAFAALLAVLGPGLLAGLSDDDPAGITTYSILGTEYGYRFLWIIPVSTVLLVQFHLLAVRIGAATGMGFVRLLREHWGHGWGYAAVVGLLFANFGTICAEYAGIAAVGGLLGIPAWISAPVAGIVISAVIVLGSFHRVEHVLLAISATLALYLVDGVLADPDWSQVWRSALVPRMPGDHAGWIAIAATLGTTLAPWGLAFIQSYAVDKKVSIASLKWERVEIVIGSLLTGIIGFAIAVACAATLHRAGVHIEDAGDAAMALRPLAGAFATGVFGVGLLGAALLAAAIVPLATAYSIAEGLGAEASLDLQARPLRLFYAAYIGLTVAAVSVVALPGIPLIPVIYTSQVVNAVLLPLHVAALLALARDPVLMGGACNSRPGTIAGLSSLALVVACVVALAFSWWR